MRIVGKIRATQALAQIPQARSHSTVIWDDCGDILKPSVRL